MRKVFLVVFAVVFISAQAISQTIDNPNDHYVDYNNMKLPETPNGASIGSYGDIQVNPSTGVPNISIPIYTIEVDGVQVPISLSYDASGIKVEDIGTAVGLNWKLNAGGGLFRTVQTKPDENYWMNGEAYISDTFYATFDPENHSHQTQIKLYAENRDHNPDIYSYNFLGLTGSYIQNTNGMTVKFKEDQLDIDNRIDYRGNTYIFGVAEQSENIVQDMDPDTYSLMEIDWNPHDTGWMLTKVITKNGKEIDFQYQEVQLEYYHVFLSQSLMLSQSCSSTNSAVPAEIRSGTFHKYTIQLLEKITTDGIEITFSYTTDTNLAEEFQKKLTSITIKDLIKNNQKKFILEHSIYSGDSRLRLDGIYEVDDSDNPLPGYEFAYKSGSLPVKNSKSKDFFGYYNGKSNAGLVHKSEWIENIFDTQGHDGWIDSRTGDRSLSETHLKTGILEKIVFPTGGSTEFEYAANKEGDRYSGGLRVEGIVNKDTDGTEISERQYQYSGMVGHDLSEDVDLAYKDDAATRTFASSIVARPDTYSSGHFYKNVTIISKSVDNADTYKEEHTYEDYNGTDYYFRNPFTSYEGLLKEKRLYKGTQLLKIEEYQYDFFGDDYTFTWNILSDRICYGHVSNRKTGYDVGIPIEFTGNRIKLPSLIATTDYLSRGSTQLYPVTTVKTMEYNDYLFPVEEITDYQRIRVVDGSGNVSYDINDAHADIITTTYTYPNDHSLSLPRSLPISKITHSENEDKTIYGQYFVYDNDGNIQKTFQYNKGQVGNTHGGYVPNNYEEKTTFVFEDGKTVQVQDKDGRPVSYIWGYEDQYPVAKIENMSYSGIPSGLIDDIKAKSETGTEAQLITSLNNLRNHNDLSGAMVTTYTHKPLVGVSTITDPKGDIVTYHYDAFGRLDYVTDADGNKLEEYDYHYESE